MSRRKPKLRPPAVPRVFAAACLAFVVAIVIAVTTGWRPSVPMFSNAVRVRPPAIVQTQPTPAAPIRQGSRAPIVTPATQPPATAGLSASPAASVGEAGQRVSIDPRTRELRPVEHDEIAAMKIAADAQRRARRARQASAAEPQEFLGPGGAVGMAVPEDLLTFTVATKTPDGRIVVEHATGSKDTRAKVRASAKKSKKVDRKEERNDR
jgi:hypothetical protein